jgi:hypothetical protein
VVALTVVEKKCIVKMATRESNRLGSAMSASPRRRNTSPRHYKDAPIGHGDDALNSRSNTGGAARGDKNVVRGKYLTLHYWGIADHKMDSWIEDQERENPGYYYKSRDKINHAKWAVMFERIRDRSYVYNYTPPKRRCWKEEQKMKSGLSSTF